MLPMCSILYMSEDSRLPLHRMINAFKISISCCSHLLVLQSLFCFNLDARNLKAFQFFCMSFYSKLLVPVFSLIWTEWCVPGNGNHMLS